MDPWAWAILLLIVGLALAILEVFIPSGGVLGFLAVCSILGSIVVAFLEGRPLGLAVLGTAIIVLPTVVILALRWWPKTPVGRKVLLPIPKSDEVLPDSHKRRDLRNLIGRVGKAKSKMLPSGAVSIDGRTIDAISEGIPIEPGQPVRVIEVRGTRVVVRPVDEQTPAETESDSDPLSRPIDSVAPDPFEDPPA